MIDILPYLRDASEHREHWGPANARALAQHLTANTPSFVQDWDDWAGEQWIRLAEDGLVVVLIRTDVPLVLTLGERGSQIARNIADRTVVLLDVEDWETPCIMLDLCAARALLPCWRWPSEAAWQEEAGGQCVSPWTLWWATV